MKKEKTVRTYQRRTKSGKMVTVREHKASYNAAEEARKAAAKKAGAGSELSKKKAAMEESPLGFSADDYKEWYHWDMEDDANNEAALRVEKALIKKMGKKAYNKYLEDMSNSYSARGHKKAHQALLDEHTAQQKKQDAKSKVSAKDVVRDAKDSSKSSTTPKKKAKDSDLVEHYDQFNNKHTGKAVGDSFTFSEGRGKDKVTYDARFVTDGSGRYGYVVRDKEEGPDAKYYVGISDGYEKHSQLPAGLRKAAETQGLRFKGGEFVKNVGASSKSKDTKQKGPGEFVVPSKMLTRYKGDPSELSVARRRGEEGYIIKTPSGTTLAKYDSASAARKALKAYQESVKTEKTEPKTKKLTARDYQSMSDEDLQKHYANYRYRTNSSLSRSEQYHKKTIAAEVARRSEAKTKAEEKSARKAVGGLVSGSTWKYNSSDGSFSTLDSTAWGRPDSSRVKKLIQKAKDAGWKKANHSDSMQPDDKGYRSTERYVSPDGKHELTYRYSAGDFSRNNHYVTIRRIKSDEAPTKQAEPKAKSVKKETKGNRSVARNVGSKKPLTSLQNHAVNTLLNQPGWTMSKAEKYVRTLSDKEVRRLAHKDM